MDTLSDLTFDNRESPSDKFRNDLKVTEGEIASLYKKRINILRKHNLQTFDHLLVANYPSRENSLILDRHPILDAELRKWKVYSTNMIKDHLFIPELTPSWSYFKDCNNLERSTKLSRNPILQGLTGYIIGEYLNEENFDISSNALVVLGQLATVLFYFNQPLREAATKILGAPIWQSWKKTFQENVSELSSHVALGTCLLTANDAIIDGTVSDAWISVALLSAVCFGQKLSLKNMFKVNSIIKEKDR